MPRRSRKLQGAVSVRIQRTGLRALDRKTKAVVKHARRMTAEAIERAVNLCFNEAVRRVPVDTGRLRSSLYRIFEDVAMYGAVLTDSTHYAWFVELGTRHMEARPFLRNAFNVAVQQLKRDLRRIPRRAARRAGAR